MKHKIFIAILIVAIILTSLVSATASDDRTYNITDSATDINYIVKNKR